MIDGEDKKVENLTEDKTGDEKVDKEIIDEVSK